MAVERTYTIPLRKEWLKTAKYRRAKKAGIAIRSFLARHMKVAPENIKVGRYLNLELWKHGIKNPPPRVRVNVTKDDSGIVSAELVGAPKEKAKSAEKNQAKKAESKPEVKAPEKKEEPKQEKPEVQLEKKQAAEKKEAPTSIPEKKAPAPKAPAQKQQGLQIIR